MIDYLYIVVFVLLQIAFWFQIYYITVVYSRLARYKISDNEMPGMVHPVSVVICARNEEKNLEKNLPLILQQDYPDFEVVVVNDCSVDDSHMILRGFASIYQHLKVVTLNEHERFKHGKKFALTLGIKAAKNEHLLFTDADCVPVSRQWIHKMQRNFTGTKEIILGFSPYVSGKGLLNKIIQYETFLTAISYFSYALLGNAYMGVGRNLAYTKSLFFRVKGFASHMHILSGDDDLFVNQNATLTNVAIELHPESHMLSAPKTSFSSYLTQKIRHFGAGKAYKSGHKRMLSIQNGSAILFYLTLAALIVLDAQWWMLLTFYLLRLIIQGIVFYPVLKKFNSKDLIWWIPLLDLIFYFYILVLTIISLFRKKVKWK